MTGEKGNGIIICICDLERGHGLADGRRLGKRREGNVIRLKCFL